MQSRHIFYTRHIGHDLFYRTVPHSLMKIFLMVFKIEGIEASTSREDNSESVKVRVVILVRNISSRPICHNCKVL